MSARRLLLLAPLLLLPLLACADPGGALAAAAIMELIIALVALATSVLAVWSLLRLASQRLYGAQLAFFSCCLLLGLLTFDLHTNSLTSQFDPLWSLALPLGGWRTGLGVAQAARKAAGQYVGLGVAYQALHYLLLQLLELPWHFAHLPPLPFPLFLLLAAALLVATWLVLSRQLPLAQWAAATPNGWWQLPVATAAVGLGCFGGYWLLFQRLHTFHTFEPAWDYLATQALAEATVGALVGAALLRPRPAAA